MFYMKDESKVCIKWISKVTIVVIVNVLIVRPLQRLYGENTVHVISSVIIFWYLFLLSTCVIVILKKKKLVLILGNACGLYYRVNGDHRPHVSKISRVSTLRKSFLHCANCGTNKTTMWRRDAGGVHVCNACGLFFRINGFNR